MRERKHTTTLPLALLLGPALLSVVNAQAFFNDEPLVRFSATDPGNKQAGDLFGYATLLHRVNDSASPSDFSHAIANTKIIVGAPYGTYPGTLNLTDHSTVVNNTGLVYVCPIQPGPCTDLSGNGVGDDIRLFDFEANDFDTLVNLQTEEKGGQFMGATLTSSGDHFMACAPRWISLSIRGGPVDRTRVHGRCYLSSRDLKNFKQIRPCSGGNSHNPGGESFCMAGFSASLYERETNLVSIFMGGPPYDDSNGAVFNLDVVNDVIPEEPLRSHLQFIPERETRKEFWFTGIAVTQGRVFDQEMKQLIYSIPKSNSYKGSVAFQLLDGNSSNVTGRQVGEYFGSAIAVADLNGDNYDELIVGAPLYSELGKIESGRVYVFMNTEAARENKNGFDAENPIIRSGSVSNGRFGSAIANIGDINDDGYEDIAISSPLEAQDDNSEGAVYIYYGAGDSGISEEPNEVIRAKDIVNRISGQEDFKLQTFGFSLSSGVDVDANFYDDLVIGGYKSSAVVVLRALSRATVSLSLSTEPADQLDYENKNCTFNMATAEQYACFDLIITGSFSGRGLDDNGLNTVVEVEEVRVESNEPRLFFVSTQGDMVNSYKGDFYFNKSGRVEDLRIRIFVKNEIEARRSNLTVAVTLSSPERQQRDINGSQNLIDLREIPVISVLPMNGLIQELPLAGCGEDRICNPSLQLSLNSTQYIDSERRTARDDFVVGRVDTFEVLLDYYTTNEDVIDTEMNITLPPNIFMSSGVKATILSDLSTETSCNISGTVVICTLQPILSVSDGIQRVKITVPIRDALRGDELATPAIFVLQDNAQQYIVSDSNNTVEIDISVSASATIRIPGMTASPNQSRYSTNDFGNVVRYDELGNLIAITTRLSNNGPSTIPNAQANIYIPGRAPMSEEYFYLYPGSSSVQLTQQGRETNIGFKCSGLNPEDLEAPPRNSSNARRRRDVSVLTRLQDLMKSQPEEMNIKKRALAATVDCSLDRENCYRIVCDFTDFSPGTISLVINTYVDRRFYRKNRGDYRFVAYSTFSIKDDFVEGDSASLASNPFEVIEVKPTRTATIPIYVYVVSIIGALLVLLLIIILLYLVGFFRLRRKEERIAKEKERRRSLSSSAVTATVVPPENAREEVDLDSKPDKLDDLDEKPLPEDEETEI